MILHGVVGGLRRAPQGARGLKSLLYCALLYIHRRAPQGARGLKLIPNIVNGVATFVAPRNG